MAWMVHLGRSGRQQRESAIGLQRRGAYVQFDRPYDDNSENLVSAGPVGLFADMFSPNVVDVFAENKPLTDAD